MNIHIRKLQIFLALYVSILLLSMAAVYIIPKDNLIELDMALREEMVASQSLYEAALEGRIGEVENKSVNGRWVFEYTGEELGITVSDRSFVIMVERKKVDDGKIEVVSYMTPIIVDQIDFTERIEAPKVALEGDKLKLQPAAPYKADFARFRKEFTVTQFLGSETEKEREGFAVRDVMGQQLLYLLIPNSLQIDDDNHNVQIVGEE